MKAQCKIFTLSIMMWAGIVFAAFFCVDSAWAAETATLRIISTTDTHGQVTTTNYDTAGARKTGSLAQAYTLIKEAREEVKNGTSVTVDIGDNLYGYGTDYIYDNMDHAVQYIYAAMRVVNYDAMTLGNHDFDYGYYYAYSQLQKAGLSSRVVLSNVYDIKTKKTIWAENKIVTKTMRTSAGKNRTLKIGMIGVTIPSLTSFYDHDGILGVKDIVQSVREQVTLCRQKGANVIVVLAHSGIGTANPAFLADDAVYAITKINGVDAVMCGHSHLNYPSGSASVQGYYALPGVDKKTGLMNGKPVVMVADRGAGIGVADLNLTVSGNGYSVTGRSGKIVYTNKNTEPAQEIIGAASSLDAIIQNSFGKVLAQVEDGKTIQNYFGLLSDNRAIELSNESKIQLGLQYIKKKGKAYRNYRVIAASGYSRIGREAREDYADISGDFTMGDVLGIQAYYHNTAKIYTITGAMLKEWLESIASAYHKPGMQGSWADSAMQNYVNTLHLTPVLTSSSQENAGHFFVLDGIEYEFDISKPAKYDNNGKLLNAKTSRVSSLTCSGQPVKSTDMFVIVTDFNLLQHFVNGKAIASSCLEKTGKSTAEILRDYITSLGKCGAVYAGEDGNWRLKLPAGYNYLIRSSALSEEAAKLQPWYVQLLALQGEYAYYLGNATSAQAADKNGPFIVLSQDVTVETGDSVQVAVQVNDASGVAFCKVAKGSYDMDDAIWSKASNVKLGSFTVKENGVYTVRAEDKRGNRTLRRIKIDNIKSGVLEMPDVDEYTNKTKALTGMAVPGTILYAETSRGTFHTTVKADGTFSLAMPPEKSGAVVKAYIRDGKGRISKKALVSVRRKGPNYPTVYTFSNKSKAVKGLLNDTDTQIFAVVGRYVYVGKSTGGKQAYITSKRYNADKVIVETEYKVSGGRFELKIPNMTSGESFKVYAVDLIGRCSLVNQVTVSAAAPDIPVLYTACDQSPYVLGYVPNARKTRYTIKIKVGKKTYKGKSDKKGRFSVKVNGLKKGKKIKVTATDKLHGKKRTSLTGTSRIETYLRYYEAPKYSQIRVDRFTEASSKITGKVKGLKGYIYVKADNEGYRAKIAKKGKKKGRFTVKLNKAVKRYGTVHFVVLNEYNHIYETMDAVAQPSVPAKPKIGNRKIKTSTKTITVMSKMRCTAVVRIGNKEYASSGRKYNKKKKYYIYKVKIGKQKAGTQLSVYMKNAKGKGAAQKMTVEK